MSAALKILNIANEMTSYRNINGPLNYTVNRINYQMIFFLHDRKIENNIFKAKYGQHVKRKQIHDGENLKIQETSVLHIIKNLTEKKKLT